MLEWLKNIGNLGSLASILGLLLTIFILLEARKIRKSFILRARLPQLIRDLTTSTSQLSEHLKILEEDKQPALKSLAEVKALLDNISSKLPAEEKKKVESYLLRLRPRSFYFFRSTVTDLDEDSAWVLYTELSGLVMALKQLEKDSRWH